MSKANAKKTLPDLSQMRELVQKLTEENEALKRVQANGGRALKGVTLESYTPAKPGSKPVKMVGFDLGGMPFSLSFKKCRAVLDNAKAVQKIIADNE